jgi:hypothetical protein
MEDVLALLTDIGENPKQVRQAFVMVKFAGDDDYECQWFAIDLADMAYELRSQVLKLRGA